MRVVLACALIACGGGGGANRPKEVVSEFVAALETGNLDEAKGYLAPGDDRLNEMAEALARVIPKGSITSVKQDMGDATFGSYTVDIDGAPAAEVVFKTVDGRACVVMMNTAGAQVVTDP